MKSKEKQNNLVIRKKATKDETSVVPANPPQVLEKMPDTEALLEAAQTCIAQDLQWVIDKGKRVFLEPHEARRLVDYTKLILELDSRRTSKLYDKMKGLQGKSDEELKQELESLLPELQKGEKK